MLVFSWSCLVPLLAAQPATEPDAAARVEALEARLKEYEGVWRGEFTVSSTATGYKETYPVEQQYWWEHGILKGVAVFEREGTLVSARSMSLVNEGRLYTEITRDTGREVYTGVAREGWISWLPKEVKEVSDRQMKEFFEEQEGKRYLVTEGFDAIGSGDRKTFIVYKGRLEYQGPVEQVTAGPDGENP